MNDQTPQSLWDIVRRGVWPAVGAVLMLYLFTLSAETVVRTAHTAREGAQATRTMSVEAQGKAAATPDTARLTLAVVTEGKEAEAVVEENTKKLNAMIAALKAEGVDAKDITTNAFNLYPKYSQAPYPTGEPAVSPANPFESRPTVSTIVGYSLTQELLVKIRTIAKVGPVIARATELGANQVGGVAFFIDDPDALKAKARAEAFEKGRSKAIDLANEAGVRLGRVVNVSEYASIPQPYTERYLAEGRGGGGGAPATIEPGSQEVVASITVTYEIL